MKGCLIVVGILGLGVAILGVVVFMKWKGWAATAATVVANQAINSSGLPPGQQALLAAEIQKLADDFKSGRLSTADLERVMRSVANGPLIPAAGVLAARQKYIEPSDMSTAEKTAAIRSLQRYARGVFEKKLPHESVQVVTEPISVSSVVRTTEVTTVGATSTEIVTTSTIGQNRQFKDHATRAEIDLFVARAKQAADDTGIPDEPFEPDWGLELKKAIGAALKGP
jgi:hypothetical protein